MAIYWIEDLFSTLKTKKMQRLTACDRLTLSHEFDITFAAVKGLFIFFLDFYKHGIGVIMSYGLLMLSSRTLMNILKV